MKKKILFTILDNYVIGRVSIRINNIQIKINYHPKYKNITSYIFISYRRLMDLINELTANQK